MSLIDTYIAWAIRKVGEPYGFVRNPSGHIYLTDEERAQGYKDMGYEAVKVVVDLQFSNIWDGVEDATRQQMEGRI